MRILALAFLLGIKGYAQLHLIAGSPTPKGAETFAADLLKLNADGTFEIVEELTSPEEGMWWIESADDARKIAILTAAPTFKIVVVDMDQGLMVKQCEEWPDVPGYLSKDQWPFEHWLLADGIGKLLVGRKGEGVTGQVLQGVSLDPDVPCDASFRTLNPGDVAKIYVQGAGGIGELTGIEPAMLLVDNVGSVRLHLGFSYIYLGYTIPSEYWGDMKVPLAGFLTNNSKVLVMIYWDRENPSLRRTIAYDKVRRTWSELSLPDRPRLRAFGSVVAMSETVVRTAKSPAESAGKSSLRKEPSRNGPSTVFAIKEAERYDEVPGHAYLGRLHVYDIATGKRSVIVTNEADSEVVLVDGDSIYYRVNDKLYSVPFGTSGLRPGQLIATDDRIRDAHWAFMK